MKIAGTKFSRTLSTEDILQTLFSQQFYDFYTNAMDDFISGEHRLNDDKDEIEDAEKAICREINEIFFNIYQENE